MEICSDNFLETNPLKINNHPNLPSIFRMLIIGPSNSGKTMLLYNMLLTPNYIDYNNLIIFSKTAFIQPSLKYIKDCFDYGLTKENVYASFKDQVKLKFDELNHIFENRQIKVTLSDKENEIQPPDKLDKKLKNLIVFDDVVNEKNQHIMEMYFTRGRHNKCSVIYLSQSYFDLPLKSIRNNTNVLVLFDIYDQDKSLIHSKMLSRFIDKDEFYYLYNFHMREKYKYFFINLETKEVIPSAFE